MFVGGNSKCVCLEFMSFLPYRALGEAVGWQGLRLRMVIVTSPGLWVQDADSDQLQ